MDQIKINKRKQVEEYFKKVAYQENAKIQKVLQLSDFLDQNDKRRVLICLPESIGDIYLATSLFESIRNRYPRPEWTIYFATKPEYFEILDGNPYIDKVIPFFPEMESHFALTGIGANKGFFDIVYPLMVPTQRYITYVNNGIDKHDLNFY